MASEDIDQTPPEHELLRMKLQDLNQFGVSQRYLSRAIGIPRTTLQDFMTGRVSMPREGTLERIREAGL